MPQISSSGKSIGRSTIRSFHEKQDQIAASCGDMISFSIGEPDFPTPPHIVEAAVTALCNGYTKYAPNAGLPELRTAIAQQLRESHGVCYDPHKEIVITGSGMDTLRLATQAILNANDEILIGDPHWSNHPNHARMVHGRPVCVPLREENGFVFTIEELERALTSKTRALLLNYPNNPTGAVISLPQLRDICLFCKRHDLWILSDEVYKDIIFDGLPFYSPAMLPDMKERVVIIQSFSKSYAMTGWRLAYAAGPAPLIEALGRLNENSISCVNTFVQMAGVVAMTAPQDSVRDMRAEYQRRRDLVYDGIAQAKGLSCIKPQGAFYCFVRIADTGLHSEEFAKKLLETKHVSLVPGSGFGAYGEGFVRLCYATSTKNVEEGLRRIQDFCRNLC